MRTLNNIWEAICGTSLMFVIIILPFLRSKLRKWGSTKEELARELSGDDLIEDMKGWYNHAITIKATPAAVWPWIVQLGQNKGGFYSYELLENIAKSKIHNVDRIVPEFQDTAIGDAVMMTPTAAPYIVSAIDSGRAFILRLRVNLETQQTVNVAEPLPPKYQDGSWLFLLEETSEGKTRMITRSRNKWNQSKTNTFFYGLFGIISMVMDRKMLKGIRKRAEKAAKAG
ncbi:MAG: hypothetical protein HN929_11995 [Chloroflexi bacterium]|jgi:hypothetical protein|nr:hypothetical protein [Chloroflexota bacterium]MBT7082161.1 hypothetical protein [Chloroflexota bacterium]MBT7290803.1 hypothetical protein [Chloroflexota bacterium]